MGIQRHLFLTAFLLMLCACAAGGSQAVDARADMLPGIAGLDSLRSGSATQLSAALQQQFLSQGSGWNGSEVELSPAQDSIAYCVYRFEPPTDSELINIFASGSGELWLLLADYGSGRWGRAVEFSGGNAQIALSGLPGMLSPAGYFYAALVAPHNGDGRTASLVELTLTVEEAVLPGPTFYVAPPGSGGNDANPGSSDLPWATLQHAADSAMPGDTIIVRPGEYSGMMIERSGAPGQYIRFIAEPGAEIVEENPTTPDGINIENWAGTISYVWVEGFTVTGMPRAGIRAAHAPENGPFPQHITIRNNVCRDNFKWGILTGFIDDVTVEGNTCFGSQDEHGIYISNSGDRAVVRGNTCHGNSDCGMHFNGDASVPGGDGILSDMLIEYNICYGNGAGIVGGGGGSAINMDGVQDCIIRGNLLYDNHASGISIYAIDGTASANNLVINNTVVIAENGRWCLNIQDGSVGNTAVNNIFWNNHSIRGAIDIDSASLSGFVSNSNVLIGRFVIDEQMYDLAEWRSETGHDLQSVEQLPSELFVDSAAFDFHILPGSAAEDSGVFHADMPVLDLDGLSRPLGLAIDAGAYELAP